jgi:hypothetical protein
MAEEPIRLGGMALTNGVLVHGPNSWACAIRLPDGRLEVAAELKRFRASEVTNPLFRGSARFAEAISLLPRARRRLSGMKLPFERPRVLTAMTPRGAADCPRLRPVPGRARDRRRHRVLPRCIALRSPSGRPPRHEAHLDRYLRARRGAQGLAVGSPRRPAPGSLMIGNVLASRAPRQFRFVARGLASVAAVAVATEIFSWMVRNPEHPLSKALAKPGHELQHRLATAEPTPEQLEVAEAALAACLELEDGHRN